MKQLSEIEERFVRDVLDSHGEYVRDLLEDTIDSKNLRKSDDLINSLKTSVVRRGSDFVLQIMFLSYGRSVEIQWYKSKALRKEARELDNKSSELRRAKKKDTRFYSKNVYGSINRLLSRMSSEYSDAEIERLKKMIEYQAGLKKG